MILEQIIDLVAVCAKKGVQHVILSPGSRCAPLTLAFARYPEIHTRTISDERAAAFIALGMAQQLGKPVALVCTSGSAALNYYPAIAEAFFQEIPLLVLTADRPQEWIDQYDGQTIFQTEVYGKHVKGSYQFPNQVNGKDDLWLANRISNEAINLAKKYPAGPVHINIPLKEPFYPQAGEVISFPENPRIFNLSKSTLQLSEDSFLNLKNILASVQNLVIVPGQQKSDATLQSILDQLSIQQKAVVVADTISNLQSEQTITFHDHWLGNEKISENLKPDLIISFGKSIISKSLKLFLRNSDAPQWHIQENGEAKDTYQSLSQILPISPKNFLLWLSQNLRPQNPEYHHAWHSLDQTVSHSLPIVLDEVDFGEYGALNAVLKKVLPFSKIHVANSMAVRYLNFLGKRNPEIFCNRGTSGIDGSNSTAVGCTFTTKDPVTLITGDLAFFYDRNAFWHNYAIPNLRIVLLNNHAGGIFRMIDGPKNQPELEEFFETKQKLNAQHLATEFGFFYVKVQTRKELDQALTDFYAPGIHPKILEIETESPNNHEIIKTVKERISEVLK
ncbi:2-succinyl-5-enolpyruvyl-6-hydroxy-3-cyclohexene-1-carboxylic-acid synthase [Algoriphagus pacificus]|uniref:2-succinyl-5-enolpyruvyl-6-hydroxy-3-cyclohexene-1-carboxylate synthase n=1 Tax=Algoriphagus pacificus TaxID=2811234 RepID=A0ABS3CG11_9BACT|nr:2-succinyl-5-enolpyruvyl-6-hydroxy-3-cyclohexene-1-carboxylic-acid synthase [Algoriphagus pacificus]MBN7815730.1 2-succinyl-5-enolpyruvyl-6-hydroxy-3-cyclohexene-1-carboxylic-acid synthase [Algoriphagus pacificus]